MNKGQLIESIAQKSGLSHKDAGSLLAAFVEVVKESLGKGEAVSLVGFGTFLVRDRAARTGRNPRTNEVVQIPAVKIPSFKAGRPFKDKVNS